jgi:flagellar hook-associated protein 2
MAARRTPCASPPRTTTATTPTITVASDQSGAKTAIEKLVKTYNDAVSTIKNQSSYNTTTKTAAALNGESVVQNMRSRLSSVFTGEIAPGVTFSSIGVAVQKDGTLAIDSDKLTAALESGAAKNLFLGSTGVTGLASKIDSAIEAMIEDDGLISNRTDGLETSMKYLDRQKDQLNLRLEQIEARYRRQFTALDTLMSSMNTTSSYLAQQLANLPTYSS